MTRNSELLVDEEKWRISRSAEGELAGRGFARAMRLEIAENCPKSILRVLLKNFDLPDNAVYRINGPVNLNRVTAVYDLVDRAELKFPAFTPRLHPAVDGDVLFDTIRHGDVLLHHPYDSFATVIELIKQSSQDPAVLAIKQTLYRAGKDSILVNHLIEAARNGKDVPS